jgi:16S rRNA G966 N2-methylase RsmD
LPEAGLWALRLSQEGQKRPPLLKKALKPVLVSKNIDTLHFTSIAHLFPLDVEKALVQLGTFDLIFMDPPYDLDIGSLTAKALTHLKEGGLLIVEQSKRSKFLENLTYVKKKEFGDTFLYFFDSKHPKPPCST